MNLPLAQKLFTTRLEEAKRHLKKQIQELILRNRINKLGLITFNNQVKIQVNLTDNFKLALQRIEDQRAHGSTALYDSIIFARRQLNESQNPRILIMTDGEDNPSRQKMEWMQQWFQKEGLKSTFFTICQGDNETNKQLAYTLNSKYLAAGPQKWFSNKFDSEAIDEGFSYLMRWSEFNQISLYQLIGCFLSQDQIDKYFFLSYYLYINKISNSKQKQKLYKILLFISFLMSDVRNLQVLQIVPLNEQKILYQYKIMQQRQYQHSSDSSQLQEQSEQSYSQQEDSSQKQQQKNILAQLEIQKIKQQLKNVPYQIILKQKKAIEENNIENMKNKHGTKKLGKRIRKIQKSKTDKLIKNQAQQVSIYQRPKRKSQIVVGNKKTKRIDPRFQQYAGHYNRDLAMKSYDFIPKLQQLEIQQLKSKLKGNTKRHKLTSHQRDVLMREYNNVTSDYKRGQLVHLQKETKHEIRDNHGYVDKKEFKQEFQRKKLQNMSEGDRQKKMREQRSKVLRGHMNERRQIMKFKNK